MSLSDRYVKTGARPETYYSVLRLPVNCYFVSLKPTRTCQDLHCLLVVPRQPLGGAPLCFLVADSFLANSGYPAGGPGGAVPEGPCSECGCSGPWEVWF